MVYSFFIYAFNINKCATPAKYQIFKLSMRKTHSENDKIPFLFYFVIL